MEHNKHLGFEHLLKHLGTNADEYINDLNNKNMIGKGISQKTRHYRNKMERQIDQWTI